MPDLFTVAKFPKYVGSVYATGGVGGGSRPPPGIAEAREN